MTTKQREMGREKKMGRREKRVERRLNEKTYEYNLIIVSLRFLYKIAYLNNFDDKAERDGEGEENEQKGEEGDKVGADTRAFLAS